MEIRDSIKTCLFEKFATFNGRATRSEFWWFMLFLIILDFAAGLLLSFLYAAVAGLFMAIGLPTVGLLLGIVIAAILFIGLLLLLVPSLAVASRRLHDRDLSALWLLLLFIPTIGAIAIIIICALPGTKGPNRFGEDLLENEYNTYRDFKYENTQDNKEDSTQKIKENN